MSNEPSHSVQTEKFKKIKAIIHLSVNELIVNYSFLFYADIITILFSELSPD